MNWIDFIAAAILIWALVSGFRRGLVMELIFILAWVIFGIFSLVAIIKVLMDQYWQMPVVHQIASKITL